MKVIVCLLMLLLPTAVFAGSYTSSAHGNSSYGVLRGSMAGYSRGNCAHCHEMHGSLGGDEPNPVADGSPSPYTLFTNSFDTSSTAGSYSESDVVCFYCHNLSGTVQQVTNYDYSKAFGCASSTGGPSSIMEAFNGTSQHDLHDVWDYAKSRFSWFNDGNNPCCACHNPHLARRDWANPINPSQTAISIPTDHNHLYGDDSEERMNYYSSYQAPYCSGLSYEPGGSGSGDGSDMTNYVDFCQSCHANFSSYAPSDLNKTPRDIDWSATGDKHGGRNMDGSLSIKGPYSSSGGYVLSCLDCHEPHGSSNLYLIRRRVNGGDLSGTIGGGTKDLGYLCRRCHKDDEDFTGNSSYANRWEYVHHRSDSGDPPYSEMRCWQCHGSGGWNPPPIKCTDCHYHGAIDPKGTGRRTF